MSLESTEALLGRVADGDAEALDRLYGRYLTPLQAWARGRLPRWARDLLETDDLVQETLLRTLRSVDHFDPEHSGAFQAYLRHGVLNRIRDEMRRVGRRPHREGWAEDRIGEPADHAPTPVEEAIGRETMQRYEGALLRLSPADREAVIARIELGFSYAEVAEAVGKASPDAARMAVKRALVRLAEEMTDGA